MKTNTTLLKKILLPFLIFLFTLLNLSCGSKQCNVSDTYLDSSGSDSIPDTASMSNNEKIYRHPAVEVQRQARLAYNYSPEMTRLESKDINVIVSIKNPAGMVKDGLMKIIAQQQNPVTHKPKADSVVVREIDIYTRIRVELLDPDSAFVITKIFGEKWQSVDSIKDNRWRWSVKPITDSRNAKLIVKVIAVTPEGIMKDVDDQTFYIKIKLTGIRLIIRSWFAFLEDNPGWVVTAILVPLIVYFGKRYFERKRQTP